MASCSNSGGEPPPGMAKLSLVSSESLGLEKELTLEHRAMGMVVSEKCLKNNVVKLVLKEAWARFGGVKIGEVNDNMLVFDFATARDRDQVLDLSPWTIHGLCLNVKPCLESSSELTSSSRRVFPSKSAISSSPLFIPISENILPVEGFTVTTALTVVVPWLVGVLVVGFVTALIVLLLCVFRNLGTQQRGKATLLLPWRNWLLSSNAGTRAWWVNGWG